MHARGRLLEVGGRCAVGAHVRGHRARADVGKRVVQVAVVGGAGEAGRVKPVAERPRSDRHAETPAEQLPAVVDVDRRKHHSRTDGGTRPVEKRQRQSPVVRRKLAAAGPEPPSEQGNETLRIKLGDRESRGGETQRLLRESCRHRTGGEVSRPPKRDRRRARGLRRATNVDRPRACSAFERRVGQQVPRPRPNWEIERPGSRVDGRARRPLPPRHRHHPKIIRRRVDKPRRWKRGAHPASPDRVQRPLTDSDNGPFRCILNFDAFSSRTPVGFGRLGPPCPARRAMSARGSPRSPRRGRAGRQQADGPVLCPVDCSTIGTFEAAAVQGEVEGVLRLSPR